ncbi:DUF6892 domain-containing protein [Maribacter sp.]|uniref:DUF6892 domain-containing protein n=1 Tax=Maribacter sp. TaxID=1897614 RepID=UPI0025BFBA0C|nr:hypothetical protein [Maribacter sp.]
MFSFLKKNRPKPIHIVGTNEHLLINDVAIEFPTNYETLVNAFGEPSRTGKTKLSKSPVICWDTEGIYCSCGSYSHIYGFSLIFSKKHQLDLAPKNNFSGTILINDENVQFGDFLDIAHPKYVVGKLTYKNEAEPYALSFRINIDAKKEIPKDKYILEPLKEEHIEFMDFGFKLAVIGELMYTQEVLHPKFELYEFAEWYNKRKIDIEEEGYAPIAEVTQFFKDIQIPKSMAGLLTEIYQDGGNEIYANLLRFGNGDEDYWDIKSAEDAKHFPNLKKVTLCYAKNTVYDDMISLGIDTHRL